MRTRSTARLTTHVNSWCVDTSKEMWLVSERLALSLLASMLVLTACMNNDNPIITPAVDPTVTSNNQGSPLVVDPASFSLKVGESQKIASLYNQDGTIKRDLPTTWVSLDPAVASVDSQGNVTALKPGNTRIKAQTLNNEAFTLITVSPSSGTAATPATPGASADPGLGTIDNKDPNASPELAKLRSIVIRPENESVQPTMFKFSRLGETRKFVAEGLDSEGQKISNLTFSWSSSDEAITTVNSTGVVTAVATGTSNLIASAGNVTSNIVQVVVQEGTIRAHIRFTE